MTRYLFNHFKAIVLLLIICTTPQLAYAENTKHCANISIKVEPTGAGKVYSQSLDGFDVKDLPGSIVNAGVINPFEVTIADDVYVDEFRQTLHFLLNSDYMLCAKPNDGYFFISWIDQENPDNIISCQERTWYVKPNTEDYYIQTDKATPENTPTHSISANFGIYQEITKESPVGTVGIVDGEECVVLDLGGTIGKKLVATKNLGADNKRDAGQTLTYNEALTAVENMQGWRLPTASEMEGLAFWLSTPEKLWREREKGFMKPTMDKGLCLFLPAAFKKEEETYFARYWTGEMTEYSTAKYLIIESPYTLIVSSMSPDNMASVRLFHNMPGDGEDFDITAHADPKNEGTFYSTFYSSESAYEMPEGVTAYTAHSSEQDGKIDMNKVDGNIVAKGEPVILKSTQADYTLVPTEDAGVKDEANILSGTDTRMAQGSETTYVFSCVNDIVGFYTLKAGAYIPAHKVYITKEEPTVECFTFNFIDLPTSIKEVNASKSNNTIYSITGQRLNKMQKGINIVGGKKVINRK